MESEGEWEEDEDEEEEEEEEEEEADAKAAEAAAGSGLGEALREAQDGYEANELELEGAAICVYVSALDAALGR